MWLPGLCTTCIGFYFSKIWCPSPTACLKLWVTTHTWMCWVCNKWCLIVDSVLVLWKHSDVAFNFGTEQSFLCSWDCRVGQWESWAWSQGHWLRAFCWWVAATLAAFLFPDCCCGSSLIMSILKLPIPMQPVTLSCCPYSACTCHFWVATHTLPVFELLPILILFELLPILWCQLQEALAENPNTCPLLGHSYSSLRSYGAPFLGALVCHMFCSMICCLSLVLDATGFWASLVWQYMQNTKDVFWFIIPGNLLFHQSPVFVYLISRTFLVLWYSFVCPPPHSPQLSLFISFFWSCKLNA